MHVTKKIWFVSISLLFFFIGTAVIFSSRITWDSERLAPANIAPGETAIYSDSSASSETAVTARGSAWLVAGTIVNGTVQFQPLFAFEVESAVEEGTHSIDVMDSSGTVLVSRAFTPFVPEPESAGDPVAGTPLFSLLVPKPAGAASLVVRSAAGEIIGSLLLGGAVPAVQLVAPVAPSSLAGSVNVKWAVTDADSTQHTTRVQYSADNGQTWSEQGVVDTNELLFDFDKLPGGPATKLRLMVSDGINSSTFTSDPFITPKKNVVTAEILSPAKDVVVESDVLFLKGIGTDTDDGTLTGSALTWSSDLAGDLGSGELISVVLTPGKHTIQLKATDSDGNSQTSHVTVRVAGAAPEVELSTEALDSLPTTCVAATISVEASDLPASRVDYSLDGGTTWIPVPPDRLPYRFIIPGSGSLYVIARAFDAAGQMGADDELFSTSAECIR